MTNEELDTIASEIHQLAGTKNAWANARKLLRSIEISALREALEVIRRELSNTHNFIKMSAISALETKIRNLELK